MQRFLQPSTENNPIVNRGASLGEQAYGSFTNNTWEHFIEVITEVGGIDPIVKSVCEKFILSDPSITSDKQILATIINGRNKTQGIVSAQLEIDQDIAIDIDADVVELRKAGFVYDVEVATPQIHTSEEGRLSFSYFSDSSQNVVFFHDKNDLEDDRPPVSTRLIGLVHSPDLTDPSQRAQQRIVKLASDLGLDHSYINLYASLILKHDQELKRLSPDQFEGGALGYSIGSLVFKKCRIVGLKKVDNPKWELHVSGEDSSIPVFEQPSPASDIDWAPLREKLVITPEGISYTANTDMGSHIDRINLALDKIYDKLQQV